MPTRPPAGLLVSGSWDQSLRLWDPRAPPYQACVATVPLPGKVGRSCACAAGMQATVTLAYSWAHRRAGRCVLLHMYACIMAFSSSECSNQALGAAAC